MFIATAALASQVVPLLYTLNQPEKRLAHVTSISVLPINVGVVNLLFVKVCVHHTVTTLAVFVPAVVTLTSSEKVNNAPAPTALKVTHPSEATVVEK